MTERDSSEQFYDLLAGDYDEAILRCVPRYFEMLDSILRYVPPDIQPNRILELGSGSGHLTKRVIHKWPLATVLAVDFSREMLLKCRRVSESEHLELVRMDFHEPCIAPQSVDLVVSSIALHHVDDPTKQRLFRSAHGCLRPGGALVYSDQFAGETPEIYATHIEEWRAESARLGASEEEWDTWMRHQDEHDHHARLGDQLFWLRSTGFSSIDCVWRYLLWTVLVARH